MTPRILPCCLVILATLAPPAFADGPLAQSNSPEADASLYGESVVLPREAAVCAERIADYAARFQRAYDGWRADNAQRIAVGSTVVHASAAKAGVDVEAEMAKLSDAGIERLRKTTPALFTRHCALLLESLAPPAN